MALTGGPVLEEVIFRCAILGGFLRVVGKFRVQETLAGWIANILTALLFGFWHSTHEILTFGDAALCALILGWLRLRSGSVAVASVAHSAINAAVMAVTPLWMR